MPCKMNKREGREKKQDGNFSPEWMGEKKHCKLSEEISAQFQTERRGAAELERLPSSGIHLICCDGDNPIIIRFTTQLCWYFISSLVLSCLSLVRLFSKDNLKHIHPPSINTLIIPIQLTMKNATTRVANEYSNIRIFEYFLSLNEYSLFEYVLSHIRLIFV